MFAVPCFRCLLVTNELSSTCINVNPPYIPHTGLFEESPFSCHLALQCFVKTWTAVNANLPSMECRRVTSAQPDLCSSIMQTLREVFVDIRQQHRQRKTMTMAMQTLWPGYDVFLSRSIDFGHLIRACEIYYIPCPEKNLPFPWITLTNLNVFLLFLAHIIPMIRFTKNV